MAFFLILIKLFNSNNNLSFLQKFDFTDSKREKKVPFFILSYINATLLCEEKDMQIKMNEIGRSMVEMLGILAV
ncbi:MAG: hypothetical protein IJO11_01815, partial [Alphaproteobacteria bacterium]|nr:hypothetical protein [Alphaproteobacteria bacterium]